MFYLILHDLVRYLLFTGHIIIAEVHVELLKYLVFAKIQ